MRKIIILLLMALSISLQAQTVKIAAAGNLKDVLQEIITEYSKTNSTTKVVANYSSSGALYQQVMNGADYDIYMAADKFYTDKMKAQGVTSGEVKTYAFGELVIWSNTLDVSKGIQTLNEKTVFRIAIVKPEIGPYGDRAVECMKYYNMYESVKEKLVYAETVTQAAQFAKTDNAQICFASLPTVLAPEMKGSYFKLAPESYKPVEQAMVLLKNWKQNPDATKFLNYVLSSDCKPIFEKYGFIVPNNKL